MLRYMESENGGLTDFANKSEIPKYRDTVYENVSFKAIQAQIKGIRLIGV